MTNTANVLYAKYISGENFAARAQCLDFKRMELGKDDIAPKDETFRSLKALLEKNSGENKPTYTVEFI